MVNITQEITFEIESKWIYEGEKRFTASTFSPEFSSAKSLVNKMKERGRKIVKIDNIVDNIFYPSRFKRVYSKDGEIFLSSKDIFDFLPIGKKLTNATEELFIEKDWLLITRSGSVGRVLLPSELTSKAAISEHVIRVVTNEKTPIGYLYAYLISKIGQPLVIRNIFGGVVDEIEPHHIGEISIPRLPQLEPIINNKISEYCSLINESQEMLIKAEDKFYSEVGLPKISEEDVTYVGKKMGENIRVFEIKSDKLNLRLDGSYHIPLAHLAISNLKKCKGTLKELKDISDLFVPPRFKRAYVKNTEIGTPLLQGTHITQIKPMDLSS